MAAPAPLHVWHNPRCSTSRTALERVRAAVGEEQVIVRLYLEDAPDRDALERVAAMLEGGAAALLRAKEPLAAALELTRSSAPEQILDALAAHPLLIERRVVIAAGSALIPRPVDLLDPWLDRVAGEATTAT